MAVAGGVRVGVPSPGAENRKKLLKNKNLEALRAT